MTLLGYFLGQISFVRSHIDLMLILIVLLSLVPVGVEYLRHRSSQRKAVL